MKHNILIIALFGVMAGMIMSGCERTSEQQAAANKENVADAKQDVKDAKADLNADWQKFKAESEDQIRANGERIDAFKVKIKKAGVKTEAKYKKGIAELEEQNRSLKLKLEEYKDDGSTKWEVFKADFSHDMDSIGKTMADLFKDNG